MTQEYEPLSEAELAKLEEAIHEYGDFTFTIAGTTAVRLIATIRDLQGQVQGLTEVLQFYADAGNFEVAMFDTIYETTKQGRADFGTRAKQALEGKQEG